MRKPLGLTLCAAIHSAEHHLPGVNSSGCMGRSGRSARGSWGSLQTIQYSSGCVVATGLTWLATFLYAMFDTVSWG